MAGNDKDPVSGNDEEHLRHRRRPLWSGRILGRRTGRSRAPIVVVALIVVAALILVARPAYVAMHPGHDRPRSPRPVAAPPIVSAGAAPSTYPTSTSTSPSPTPSAPPESTSQPPGRSASTGIAIPGVRLIYQNVAGITASVDRVAALGVGWLRFDAAWSEIETAPGTYDYSHVDAAVTAARNQHLNVLLILGTTATWARPRGAQWNYGVATPALRDGFAAFAATTARRYQGQVSAYEIWNEPNLPGSWAPQPNPTAYLSLLTSTYQAIHHVEANAQVLSGGTGAGNTGIDSVSWYRTLYANGLRSVTDGVAVHPYPDAPNADSGEMAKAAKIRAIMNANGDRAKQIWGTETGAPTRGTNAVSEATQGRLVDELYSQWATLPHAGPLLYYTLMDFGGHDREDHFGLLHTDGSAKPAYAAFRSWVLHTPPPRAK